MKKEVREKLFLPAVPQPPVVKREKKKTESDVLKEQIAFLKQTLHDGFILQSGEATVKHSPLIANNLHREQLEDWTMQLIKKYIAL